MLALGAAGLAAALTAAAFVAPSRVAAAAATYVPSDAAQVIATVPVRDAAEVAARRTLAASPERVELAVELARADIQRYRALSDPRYLGRAQATLARWWTLAEPSPEVLLLRATIEQAVHQFPEARADLDRLVRLRPDDAYRRLAGLVGAARGEGSVRGWALTALAELAYMRGDTDAAQAHLGGALALDPDDVYARNLLADLLMATGHSAEASRMLAGREQIDSHLVRRAIAEHELHGRDADTLVAAMRERIAAAAERGDRIHLREEARFALAVEIDADRAVRLARANWSVQKELADARLLAEAALAANDRNAAEPVIAWARATGVHDVTLDRFLARLVR